MRKILTSVGVAALTLALAAGTVWAGGGAGGGGDRKSVV